jgi:uncharacterized membrane protein YgcG
MPSPMAPEVPEPRTPEVAEEVVEDVMMKTTRGLFARSRGAGGQRPVRRNSRLVAEASRAEGGSGWSGSGWSGSGCGGGGGPGAVARALELRKGGIPGSGPQNS